MRRGVSILTTRYLILKKNTAMKQSIILFAFITLILFICLVFPDALAAQPAPPGGPAQNPIDGGLALLAAAGGAYAIKRLKDKKK